MNTPTNFLSWWLVAVPKQVWQIGIATIGKIADFFSLSLLLKTLFQPWKRDVVQAKNASLDVQFRLAVGNLISRLVGFVMRSAIILIGSAAIMVIFIIAVLTTAGFILLPILAVGAMVGGLWHIAYGI